MYLFNTNVDTNMAPPYKALFLVTHVHYFSGADVFLTLKGLCQLFLGCILLGLFWLFLFRFRNNRIHGISVSKRTLIHSENGILMAEVT